MVSGIKISMIPSTLEKGPSKKFTNILIRILSLNFNDSIFYALWEDYFHSLLIHNYFFPHLAYEFLGFHISEGKLFAVVKQPFVKSTESTDLNNVKEFLSANGFLNKKENDYYHPGLGLILEDLHDENVLTEDGTLQFIDTVFFLMPSFYEKE